MIPNSLRFRLLGAAVAIIVLAVQFAGLMVLVLFERNVISLVHDELDTALDQLAASLTLQEDGRPSLSGQLPDVRFRQRLAGRYWQVSADGQPILRSASLGEGALQIESASEAGRNAWRQALVGPDKQKLYASIRRIAPSPAARGQSVKPYVLIVAMDVAEIGALDALNSQLRSNVFMALGLLAVILIAAAWAQVSIGLHPLELLRTGVENIRVGKARRLSDDVPTEVQPLVTEANRLLAAQEKAIEAARARAGDLAHGLKTPLTAVSMVAEKLRQRQDPELAEELEQQLTGLKAHVERELTRTRSAANSTVTQRTSVHPLAARLLRTMERLPRGDRLAWRLDCEPDFAAPVEEVDLAEILGNLLDNARKWARSEVIVAAKSAAGGVELTIEDDGPGVSEPDRALVMRRGARLDESVPGSGLGLNIARAVVEAYGGMMALESSARGGLLVRLSFPRQPSR
ncbi:MAG TPA: sensor histidine kinase [Hyphomicrobiaceae bacterium]